MRVFFFFDLGVPQTGEAKSPVTPGLPHMLVSKVSITEFYVDNIDPEIDTEQKGTLSKAYVGKSNCLDLIDFSVEFNAALNSFGLFIVTVESCYFVYNTISYFEFRKSSSRNQPPARMHLLAEEGLETNDHFGVALLWYAKVTFVT